jgi:hypothetical protein
LEILSEKESLSKTDWFFNNRLKSTLPLSPAVHVVTYKIWFAASAHLLDVLGWAMRPDIVSNQLTARKVKSIGSTSNLLRSWVHGQAASAQP